MIIKDPKKLAQRMMVLCILIGLVALAVGIMAIAMQKYIIAVAMGIVAIGQIWNYSKWKKAK
jgi:vacuolar-type H+-ATPase subunit I/STV1